jgi:hypothetical protein
VIFRKRLHLYPFVWTTGPKRKFSSILLFFYVDNRSNSPLASFEEKERTEVVYGSSNVLDREMLFFSNAKLKVNTYMDYSRPALALRIESIKRSFIDARNRDVRLRYITDINTENIRYCKELMEIAEVLHLDESKDANILKRNGILKRGNESNNGQVCKPYGRFKGRNGNVNYLIPLHSMQTRSARTNFLVEVIKNLITTPDRTAGVASEKSVISLFLRFQLFAPTSLRKSLF